MSLHGLARVAIGVPDVDAVTGFYTDFGLTGLGDARFATSDGGEQLRLVQAPTRRVVELVVGADHGPLREHGEISLSAWLEHNDADAVLVRPDRYIFGLAGRHDPGSFEALLADAARYVGVVPAVL